MIKSYDFVILGGGFEGLVAARLLSQYDVSVAIVEATRGIAQKLTSLRHNNLSVPLFIERFANTPSSRACLKTLLSLSEASLCEIEEDCFTFEKNEFHPFVGFGETAPEFSDLISDFLQTNKVCLDCSFSKIAETLCTDTSVEVFTNSIIMKLESIDNTIHTILINGRDPIKGKHFVSTLSPINLIKLAKNLIPLKFQNKLQKSNFWTALSLELVHAKPFDKSFPQLVLQGNKNEVCLGRVTNQNLNVPSPFATSQWLTWVPGSIENEIEVHASSYKMMKKLITKAFPGAFTNNLAEKLTVYDHSFGHFPFKMNQENPLSPLKNLWFCNAKASPQTNPLLGALDASRELIMALELNGHIKKSSDFKVLDLSL